MRTKLSILAALILVAALVLSVGVSVAANTQAYTAQLKLQNSQQTNPAASGFVTVWFNADKTTMFYTIQLNNAHGPFTVTLVRNSKIVATLYNGGPASTSALNSTCPNNKTPFTGLLANAQIMELGASGKSSSGLPAQIASGNVFAVVQTACGKMQSVLRLVSSATPAASTSVTIVSPTTTGVIPGSTNNTKGTFVNANEPLKFTWKPVVGANAYRISLVQEKAGSKPGGEYFVKYHSASDPSPTYYNLGMVGWTHLLCSQCRSKLVVQPMLAQQIFDSATQQFVWSYTPLPGGLPQQSQFFWLSGLSN